MNFDEIVKEEEKYIINTYTRSKIVFTKGKGVYLHSLKGDKYLDFVSGLAVCSLGHCHPKIYSTIRNQARKLIHTSNLYYTLPQIKLAKLLFELTDGMKSFFCNSGAEANEGAIKLARKYSKTKFVSQEKYEIITALNSFHGRTLTTITATGQIKYQKGFEPLVPGFKYVPFNDINALKESIDEKTCAVMLEVIQGEGGVYVANSDYLKNVRKICDGKELLLILDEVQTGLGRTGKMFAFQHYDIKPDILTLAKSSAQGVPIGIMLAKPEVADGFKPGDHASTFGGNPLACAVAFRTLKIIRQEKLDKKANILEEYFIKKLLELKNKFDLIKEIRGKGLMLAVELNNNKAKEIAKRCLDEKLIINAIGENILRFLPPLIIEKKHIDYAIKILEKIFLEVKNE